MGFKLLPAGPGVWEGDFIYSYHGGFGRWSCSRGVCVMKAASFVIKTNTHPQGILFHPRNVRVMHSMLDPLDMRIFQT